jgi:thiamine pyrophosphate-dependent acetolactate synthase large subunit-like protein
MASRSAIAREGLRAAALMDTPLFVGNGFLSREVMALVEPGERPVLPLQGGMGLAAGVAAGYALASPGHGAVVLEGDGNHTMGWGCAQLIGGLEMPILHLVACNGVYRSTGGQRLPRPLLPELVNHSASTLGYQHRVSVATDDDLGRLIDRVATLTLPCLVYVREDPTDQVPPRRDQPSAAYAQHLLDAVAADNRGGRSSEIGDHVESRRP